MAWIWDLGFLPTKLSLDFIREIPGREFSSQALCQEGGRKIGNNGMLESLEHPPEKPGIFSVGFPFPNAFFQANPSFFFFPPLRRIHGTANPEEGAFFPMKNPWETGFSKKLESHNSQEKKKRLRGGNSSFQKFQVFFCSPPAPGGLTGAIFRISRFFWD